MSAAPVPRILVVEDNEEIAYLLDFILKREGFEVQIAPDGREAARIVSAGPAADLVILDIMLPYKDGFQLIREIRASDPWKAVPIVMLSTKSREADIVKALEAGANDYVVKPFQPFEVVARVRRQLRRPA